MAADPVSAFWAMPFSGDVTQYYNPFTSWLPSWFHSVTTQLGLININEMQTDDPDMEKQVVTQVASYGEQLNRVVAALEAVCKRLDTGAWTADERDAVDRFLRLARDLDEFKNAHTPVTEDTIQQLVAVLKSLKEQDRGNFEKVLEQSRAE